MKGFDAAQRAHDNASPDADYDEQFSERVCEKTADIENELLLACETHDAINTAVWNILDWHMSRLEWPLDPTEVADKAMQLSARLRQAIGEAAEREVQV